MTNNGCQHLSALARDELTAVHVNLTVSEYPGDLYAFVAESVWKRIEEEVAMRNEEVGHFNECFIDRLVELKKEVVCQAKDKKDYSKVTAFKQGKEELLLSSAPFFWNRIKDSKQRRKIVKRNTMTLPYGGTPYGLGNQQIDDAKKHGIDLLLFAERRWCAWLGRVIFEDCRDSLKLPMKLLSVFEAAGRLAEHNKEFLRWTVPLTNFPVVQFYVEGTTKKIWVQYGPRDGEKLNTGYYKNTLQLSVCHLEDLKMSRGKQSQGVSPNLIHSLDAAHLMLVVSAADFPVTTVHDSFGCLLADMPALYRLTREKFVELHEGEILKNLVNQIGGDLTKFEIGSLDIRETLESEFAFS
jgi:DNA-directed RNA polymerase